MRLAVLVLVLLASATAVRADDSDAADGTVESLPPGLWFRSGHYEDFVLDEEPTPPTFAVIAGSFTRASRAELAARRIDRTSVGLGYPWVVANHDLRLARVCRDEIVVVAGLFSTRAAARAWQEVDRARRSLRIVALDSEDEPSCLWSADEHGDVVDASAHHIELVQVEPTRDAPAYRVADLERVQAMDALTADDRERALSALPVACTVPRASVHAFGTADVVPPFDLGHTMYRFGWRYAPARCGGELVYVPVEQTMRATLFETRNGVTRLLQITDVSCDSPHWDAWSYSRDGREPIEGEPPTFVAACAG